MWIRHGHWTNMRSEKKYHRQKASNKFLIKLSQQQIDGGRRRNFSHSLQVNFFE
jgi:hypothetical protein